MTTMTPESVSSSVLRDATASGSTPWPSARNAPVGLGAPIAASTSAPSGSGPSHSSTTTSPGATSTRLMPPAPSSWWKYLRRRHGARARGSCHDLAGPGGAGTGEKVHRRHAHRHAHLDLVLDHRAVDVVGERALDLDAPVHGA